MILRMASIYQVILKGWIRGTCRSAAYVSETGEWWLASLYNLESGSWLAWANDTTEHHAATHCHIIGENYCSYQLFICLFI